MKNVPGNIGQVVSIKKRVVRISYFINRHINITPLFSYISFWIMTHCVTLRLFPPYLACQLSLVGYSASRMEQQAAFT